MLRRVRFGVRLAQFYAVVHRQCAITESPNHPDAKFGLLVKRLRRCSMGHHDANFIGTLVTDVLALAMHCLTASLAEPQLKNDSFTCRQPYTFTHCNSLEQNQQDISNPLIAFPFSNPKAFENHHRHRHNLAAPLERTPGAYSDNSGNNLYTKNL